ncbi:MAG: DUF58 domain-containing protein [Woeseiaceae bacterium]|jgi:uncharacterized protein (DUF58 family)
MSSDPRVHVSLTHLRGLQGAARGLSFLPKQPAGSVLNGRHASRLRGRGLNFEEMRDYLPGDDIRSIDWKATARTGSPHVRVFTEERDRPALLVVDQRMSMFFGSMLNLKSVTAAEAASIAAFRILDAGDRVGGIVFNDAEQVELVPRRSQRTMFALLESISRMNMALDADKYVTPGVGRLNTILESVARIAHHDHLVVVFSDFDGIDESTHRRLSGIAAHNDVLLMLVHDPMAERIDHSARAVIGDGRMQAEVDLSSAATRSTLSDFTRRRLQKIYAWQKEINLSVLPLSAGQETLPQIRRLMGSLAPRRRTR